MVINAFQQGQQFELQQATNEQVLIARQRREQGINALADMFGEAALAPSEFAAVSGSERAERTLQQRIQQQEITNAQITDKAQAAQDQQLFDNENTLRDDARTKANQDRIAGLNEQEFEEEQKRNVEKSERLTQTAAIEKQQREEETSQQIATAAIGFLRAGQASKAPPAETVARLAPALQQLGWTPEMIGDLPAQLANNPNLINELEGALAASKASKEKRLISTIPIRNADGTTSLMQSFSDGSTNILPEVTPLREELAGRRAAAAETRTEIAAEKIDPASAFKLAALKKAGTLTGESISEGLGFARDAVIGVENSDRALKLLDEGIRTGSFAQVRQEGARFFAEFLGGDAAQIASTDEFFASAGRAVAEEIKAFGAGTGLSDADREFAEKIVGGQIGLSEKAIRRLVKIRRDIDIKTIKNYNRDRDVFVEGLPGVARQFPRISVPGAKQPARTDIDDLLDRFAPVGGQ